MQDVYKRQQLYEDNVSGKGNDERFSRMSRAYEEEQTEIDAQERQTEDLEQFIQWIHKHVDLDELMSYALQELVKAIYIEGDALTKVYFSQYGKERTLFCKEDITFTAVSYTHLPPASKEYPGHGSISP